VEWQLLNRTFLAGCSYDEEINPNDSFNSTAKGEIMDIFRCQNGNFDLGGNDFGVLTYAYALEQLSLTSTTK
jgi:hypothetical protein